MKRRSYLKAMLAATASFTGVSAQEPKKRAQKPIVLYVDLAVDPAKEQEMLHNFHNTFKPAAMKFRGYIGVRMSKLRSVLAGTAPTGANYRFELTYASEELRKAWAASSTHQQVWPTIEKTLVSKDYTVLLYDES